MKSLSDEGANRNSLQFKMKSKFKLDELAQLEPKTKKRLRVLILADQDYPAEVVRDHVQAIFLHSRHDVTIKAPRRPVSRWKRYLPRKKITLVNEGGEPFDVILIHYSICILFTSYLPQYLREGIRKFKGIKIQIIQDEYRWIERMMKDMVYLGIHGLISSLSLENLDRVYRAKELRKVVKVSALPGYVPERLEGVRTKPIRDRNIHLVYRGRELPYWMGRAAYEKTTLSNKFLAQSKGLSLMVDVSSLEKDRIYGRDWIEFIMSSKTVLGLEGGASIFDFDGEAEKAVKQSLKKNKGISFETLSKNVLQAHEGNVVHRTITPRSFEAIALGTVQVLFKGEYRGVLEPWRHYLPLERDFSNFHEIVKILQNDEELQIIADQTHREIIQSRKYSDRILGLGVDGLIDHLRERITLKQCVE